MLASPAVARVRQTSNHGNHMYTSLLIHIHAPSFTHTGYFHRDLKPENLLCSGPDMIKVADFGLSQFETDRERTKRLCGSPGYVAPEILLGRGCD